MFHLLLSCILQQFTLAVDPITLSDGSFSITLTRDYSELCPFGTYQMQYKFVNSYNPTINGLNMCNIRMQMSAITRRVTNFRSQFLLLVEPRLVLLNWT